MSFAAAAAAVSLALLAAGTARAQFVDPAGPGGDVSPMPGTSAGRPRFSVDPTLQPGAQGTEVRIDYRMERSELLFERALGGYRGAYEVRVIFYKDKGGAQVTGEAFQRSLRLRTYSDTRLRGADIIDHVVLPAPPGKYRIQVTITDLVAERAAATEVKFEIPADSKQEIWFGDLSLGTAADSGGTEADPRARFTPVPARSFGLDLPRLAVLGEIVDARTRPAGGGPESYRIAIRIQNELRESVWKGDTTIARTGERTPFLLRPRPRSLDAGGYRILLELTSPQVVPQGKKKPVPVRRERDFRVEQTSENVAWELRSSLEVLRYVSDPTEESEMEGLEGPDERKAYWERFWKRRDPTPETDRNEALEEFYRRVQYSNQHFGAGVPGWRTDMGRTYIQRGAPDEVVRNPFNFDRPPEEIWYYYKERRAYVFVDRDGFGRYELTQIRNP
ncbi:MAG TPA: GWxTD domain-containing protein [Acidobacteriota bacterium]|nr:GWxTD domain-containing protein [Acidobacteriota bacterium]